MMRALNELHLVLRRGGKPFSLWEKVAEGQMRVGRALDSRRSSLTRFAALTTLARWARVFVAWVLIFALASSASAQAVNDSLKKAYEASREAATEAQLNEVIRLCEEGTKGTPTDTEKGYANNLTSWAYNRRGELRSEAGQEETAFADFQKAVSIDANNWRALHNRGVSYAMQSKIKEAGADFDKVITLKPNFPNVFFNRGELKSSQGEFRPAIIDYDQALKLKANDAPSLVGRGYAYYQLSDYNRAIQDYTRAIAADDAYALAYVLRADAYADLNRWNDAANDLRAAIRIAPDYGRGYQSAAWLLSTCPDELFRDPKLAMQTAQRAIELDGEEDYRYLDTLAAAQATDGQFDAALATLDKALKALPDGADRDRAELQARRALYEQKQPYREKAVVSATPGLGKTSAIPGAAETDPLNKARGIGKLRKTNQP